MRETDRQKDCSLITFSIFFSQRSCPRSCVGRSVLCVGHVNVVCMGVCVKCVWSVLWALCVLCVMCYVLCVMCYVFCQMAKLFSSFNSTPSSPSPLTPLSPRNYLGIDAEVQPKSRTKKAPAPRPSGGQGGRFGGEERRRPFSDDRKLGGAPGSFEPSYV